MMDNEILQLILQNLETINKRMDTLEQSVTDLRHAQVLSEHNITLDVKAIKDILPISMEKWDQCIAIMDHVKTMLDEHEARKIAVDVTLVSHESRITGLEQKAG